MEAVEAVGAVRGSCKRWVKRMLELRHACYFPMDEPKGGCTELWSSILWKEWLKEYLRRLEVSWIVPLKLGI